MGMTAAAAIAACGPKGTAIPTGPAVAQAPAFVYPTAPREDRTDVYHGVTVADPYRWLEDLDSEPTRGWVEAERELTGTYLAGIEQRAAIRARLTELWNYERWGVPHKEGARFIVSINDGLQDQAVLYRLDALTAEPQVLLDPNTLSSDGTVALAASAFSPDGALMAYGTSASGSDWQVWRVRDVATGVDRPDEIQWIKFSGVSWTKDAKGFYYARYAEPKAGDAYEDINTEQKLYFHRLGTDQAEDTLVYARPDQPKWGPTPKVTEDGRYLIISVRIGTKNESNVFFQDLKAKPDKTGQRPTVELLTDFAASYEFIGNEGPVFWFRTDDGAPRGRVIAIDTRGKGPARARAKELIAQSEDTLRDVRAVGERFVASYLHDAHARVATFGLDGAPQHEVALPEIGTVGGLSGHRADTASFLSFSSIARPEEIHRLDPKTGELTKVRAPKVAFDPNDYVTEQVFVTSKDGTKVPMFLTHKKGLAKDGKAPTYLYGYGGFDIPLTPSFSVPNLVWMEMGGLYAMPNLRGGGEYGKAWHEAGMKLNKHNVFDDFIASAQWLISEGWTTSGRLAIGGRSNGGLLVGATMTQRPDLFAVALPGVGVMDMLRFNQFTIGWAWESDYGSPANEDEFYALFSYSPYHNLREGTEYPATMVYTADHDDRVVPGHSYKFAAALQHAHIGDRPALIRIEAKAGHGRGKPTSKQIEEWTDLWGFTLQNLEQGS
jgi:prolyl oligopeptidase